MKFIHFHTVNAKFEINYPEILVACRIWTNVNRSAAGLYQCGEKGEKDYYQCRTFVKPLQLEHDGSHPPRSWEIEEILRFPEDD